MSTPVRFSNEEMQDIILRCAFNCFEESFDLIIKRLAMQFDPWNVKDGVRIDNWFWHLSQSVGYSMRPFVKRDKVMDTYTLTEIAKKHLKKLLLPMSIYADNDDGGEVLRNNILLISYCRNALMHDPRPSLFEKRSCIRAIHYVCSSFTVDALFGPDAGVDIDDARHEHESHLAYLDKLVETSREIMSYASGTLVERSAPISDVALGLFLKFFAMFEESFNVILDSKLDKAKKSDPFDAKKIAEIYFTVQA